MNPAELYNAGVEEFKKNNFERAIELFQSAVVKDPEFFRAYTYMAMTYQKQAQPDQAIDCYLKAILIRPDYHKAYNNLGELYRGVGRLEDALNAFESAVRLEPASTTYHYNLALTLRDLGNVDQSRQEFEKAFLLSPTDAEIVTELSALLFLLKEYKEAVELLESFSSNNPNHERTMEFQSRARALRKKLEKEGKA